MKKILLIENCNFDDFPVGGTLSFVKQMIDVLPHNKIGLVGITTDRYIKIGKWTTLKIKNEEIDFFPIIRIKKENKKPIVPLRFVTFIALLFYLKEIRKKKYRIVFTQTPQFVFALSLFSWSSMCFCFAGLGNSVKLSRYKYLRFLGKIYENNLLRILDKNADCIFAAADTNSISEFLNRNSNKLSKKIVSLPTRFDDKIFRKSEKLKIREKLNLPIDKKIYVATGRLCWIKGWNFLLDVYFERRKFEDSVLIFVGDGEDRKKIEEKKNSLGLEGVLITGFVTKEEVSEYINSGDVFLMGSFTEGWSTSLIEAAACAIPIVTTNVSSANEIVRHGISGFISTTREVDTFNDYINKALELSDLDFYSTEIKNKYNQDSLLDELKENWGVVKEIIC